MVDEGFAISENGRLKPNFPVFSNTVYRQLEALLAPLSEKASHCILNICDTAAKILKDFTPKALHDKCEPLAHINHRLDAIAKIVEIMVEREHLYVPGKKVNVGMFGVNKQN